MKQLGQQTKTEKIFGGALTVGGGTFSAPFDTAGLDEGVAYQFGSDASSGANPATGHNITYFVYESDDNTSANATLVDASRIIAPDGLLESNGSIVFTNTVTVASPTQVQIGVAHTKQYGFIKGVQSTIMPVPFNWIATGFSLDAPTTTNAANILVP